MDWFIARLGEPSTWQGLAALATVAGVQIVPDAAHGVISTGVSIIGLINVLKKG